MHALVMMKISTKQHNKRLSEMLGLKLFSTDIELLREAVKLSEENVFHYIELYILPGTFEETAKIWQSCKVPYVIHAPHSVHGMNLSLDSQWGGNRALFKETQRFADLLGAEIIIVHGGHSGTLHETIRQIKLLKEDRICLENKPKTGLNNENCIGWSPDEFKRVADAGVLNSGIVLDFGHAICAAYSLGKDYMELVNKFLVFKPRVFHLSDGNIASEKDSHLNIGQGNFKIVDLLSVVPENAYVTLETPRNNLNGINNFIKDISSIQSLVNRS
tara:strand:- start:81 stop:902 length:822 start_codon:yes stop_codon:yes gene_type:complete